jgi:hypothetical protein
MKVLTKDAVQPDTLRTALSVTFYVFLWSYALIVAVYSLAAEVHEFDDAIPLLHGRLIQQGYTPNLDFYSFYPPLTAYLNAAVFSLIGRTAIGPRVLADILFVIVLLLLIWLFRSRFPSSDLLIPVAVLLVATSIGAAISLAVWPGFALSLIALLMYFCSQTVERNRLWLVGASGVVAALAVLSRINFGGYVVFIVALDLLQQWWFAADKGRLRFKTEGSTTMAAFALPLVICSLAFLLWVYGTRINVGLSEFVFTAQRVMALRGFILLEFTADLACVIVFPSFWFFFRILIGSDRFPVKALVPVGTFVGLLMLAMAGRRHLTVALIVVALEFASVIFMHLFVHRLERCEFGLLLFFCCLLHYYMSRADWWHWRMLPVGGALLIPFLVIAKYDSAERKFDRSIATGTALAVMSAAIFVFVAAKDFRPSLSVIPDGLTLIADVLRHPRSTDSDRMLGSAPASRAWNLLYPDRQELAALRYLRERSSSSTPLFVGVVDHSALFGNDLRMYWLADQPIGVRTFQLEAKIATEASVQREIIADLDRNKNTRVILKCMPGNLGSNRGSKLLDNYLASNFRSDAQFGCYTVLIRDRE